MISILKPKKCFWCIPLREGAISITIITLILTIGSTILFSLIIKNKSDHFQNIIYLLYVWLIFSILGFLVAIFGLFAIFSKNEYQKNNYLRFYNISFSIFAIIAILLDISGIVLVALYFKHDVVFWIVAFAVDIIVLIHFALVINSFTESVRKRPHFSLEL
ncbi:hypothetical protein C2G38_2067016 [Gigaspora rosea]|uniref:MARVEL domain-containing protein n=1 Tax=Gigaspora rosea TaxID=44941 RepID=A0A397VSR7_9GLOM|nr:hypothetical protein C2G38_2067016 [Gigaspora rosea]